MAQQTLVIAPGNAKFIKKGESLPGYDVGRFILDWLVIKGILSTTDCCTYSVVGGGGGGANTDLTFTRNGTSLTVISSTGADVIIPAATTLLAGLLQASDKVAYDGLITLSGMPAGNLDLDTFLGTTIPDDSTIKAALQALETALEAKTDAKFRGVFASAALINATPLPVLGDTAYVTDTNGLTGGSLFRTGFVRYDGISWNVYYLVPTSFTGATTTIAGSSGLVTMPSIDEQNRFLSGDSTWKPSIPLFNTLVNYEIDDIVHFTDNKIYKFTIAHAAAAWNPLDVIELSPGTSASKYAVAVTGSAGITAKIYGTSGVTITKTNASTLTFTIPSGGYIENFDVFYPTGENPGATVTHVFNYTANTITNQGLSTADVPDYKAFFVSTLPVDIYHARAVGSASDFNTNVSAVGAGSITMVSILTGTGLDSGDIVVKGNF
jgi:hypothetical protein